MRDLPSQKLRDLPSQELEAQEDIDISFLHARTIAQVTTALDAAQRVVEDELAFNEGLAR